MEPTRPLRATLLGIVGVAVVQVAFWPFDSSVALATKALTLVVPVIAAAVIGGRVPAYVVAATATLSFSLLIPPVGTLRVSVAEDLVALVVFLAVAVVVSSLVAHRLEALGKLEQQRGLLLRSVSHDLRSPLTAIQAASTELIDHPAHDASSRDALLRLIGDESERLDRLVENLLNLSRIEAGALRPQRQAVDVAELVAVCESRLARLFSDVTLETDIDDDLPVIDVDFTLMSQVLTNLLENAVRHSPPGGTVVVGATDDGPHRLRLTVSDEGPGVDAEAAAAIFEPFRSGLIAGTSGIGLAICKSVVEAHGGTIAVGEAPSGGASFTVTLPVDRS